MAHDPVKGMKQAVDDHFDAAVGTHVRTVVGAAEKIGRPVREAAEKGYRWVRRKLDGEPVRRRTTDIRLPNARRQTRNR